MPNSLGLVTFDIWLVNVGLWTILIAVPASQHKQSTILLFILSQSIISCQTTGIKPFPLLFFTEWSMQTSDRNPVPAWWTLDPPKCHDCRPAQSSEGRRWIPSACFQMKSLSICVGTWTATHCLSLAGQLDIWTPVPDSKSNPQLMYTFVWTYTYILRCPIASANC